MIPANTSLFVVDLEYIVPMDEVERHIDPHMDFIAKGYAEGYFLTAGPKAPRSGGIILARADDRAALERFLAEDPFQIHGVARFTVTEFLSRKGIRREDH